MALILQFSAQEVTAQTEPDTTIRGHSKVVFSLAVSPNGKTGASGSRDKTIQLWSIPDGKVVRTLKGHAGAVSTLAFSPDGKLLASGGGDLPTAIDLYLWDVETGKIKQKFRGPTDVVACVAFSPDGKTLAASDQDGMIRFWDLSGKELAAFAVYPELKKTDYPEWAKSIAFSPDGKSLATVGYAGIFKLWDLKTRKPIVTLNEKKSLQSVAFSPDGKTLAWGSQFRLVFWDVRTNKERVRSEGLDGAINSVAFSPDGTSIVVAGGGSGFVTVLDTATGKAIESLTEQGPGGMFAVAFGKDGKHVFSGGSSCLVHTWKLKGKGKDKAGSRKDETDKKQ